MSTLLIGKYQATIYPEGDGQTGAIDMGYDGAGRRLRVKRKGKTKAGNRAFRPDLHNAQGLTRHLHALKSLAAALRRTGGKPVASCFASSPRIGPHSIALNP